MKFTKHLKEVWYEKENSDELEINQKKKVHLSSFFADTIIYRELYIRQIEKPKEVSQLFKLIVDSARW